MTLKAAGTFESGEGKAGRHYEAYPARWLILLAVYFLTIANQILAISFAAINSKAASYFGRDPGQIDLLSTITYAFGMPMCFISPYVIKKAGLRGDVLVACTLTLFGGLIRFLATANFIVGSDKDAQYASYWACLVAQMLTGLANPMLVSLPTAVSQPWFPESQVEMATGILATGISVGIVLGFGITPLFVTAAIDVQRMGWIWFIPTAFACAFTYAVFFFHGSRPPSPPSRSADLKEDNGADAANEIGYWRSLKCLMTNGPYVIIVLTIGGAVGFFNAMLTMLQQFMCSRGYTNEFSGLCGSLFVGTGVIGAIMSSYIVAKTGKLLATTKIMVAFAAFVGIAITLVLRLPDEDILIATLCAAFGVLGFGLYPLGLELAVEAIFPLDESAGTIFIFLFGQISALVVIPLKGPLAQNLTEEDANIQTCSSPGEEVGGQDHTRILLVLTGMIGAIAVTFISFAKNKERRKRANASTSSSSSESRQNKEYGSVEMSAPKVK